MPRDRAALAELLPSGAWATHPLSQRASEGPGAVLLNEFYKSISPRMPSVDPFGTAIAAPSTLWSSAVLVQGFRGFPQAMWLARVADALASQDGVSATSVAVEGLGFETLDRHATDAGGPAPSAAPPSWPESAQSAAERALISGRFVRGAMFDSRRCTVAASAALSEFERRCCALASDLLGAAHSEQVTSLLSRFESSALVGVNVG
jgi:hypothetical protein